MIESAQERSSINALKLLYGNIKIHKEDKASATWIKVRPLNLYGHQYLNGIGSSWGTTI